MRKGIIVHIDENAKDSGVDRIHQSSQKKTLTVRRAALLKALPLGADRARMRATTAERIMFGYCLAFADWNYERNRKKKGWCHGCERTKDRAREGIIDGDQVRKKNPTVKVSPFF